MAVCSVIPPFTKDPSSWRAFLDSAREAIERHPRLPDANRTTEEPETSAQITPSDHDDVADRLIALTAITAEGFGRIDLRAESIEAKQHSQLTKLDELLRIARDGGAFQRAIDNSIPAPALRRVVERLGGMGVGTQDLLPWVEAWIDDVLHQRAHKAGPAHGNNADELARLQALAQDHFAAGRVTEASSPFMQALARADDHEVERQTNHRFHRLRLLQEAIAYDKLAINAEAAAAKLVLMADIQADGVHDVAWHLIVQKADEFRALGQDSADNAALLVAVATYREALKECPRQSLPLGWAHIQSLIANALSSLGERETGADRLKEALAIYQDVQEHRTHEYAPLLWAETQNDLGNTLSRLGEREGCIERFEGAVSAYRQALTERTRERVPLKWAATQNNLGNALLCLAEHDGGIRLLEEAISAYREWAATQNNLGTALLNIGQRAENHNTLHQAATAYRNALQERSRDQNPLHWAETQNNLGNALWALALREQRHDLLEEAVVAFRLALEERTRERVPLQWAATLTNLGSALCALGADQADNAHLEEAIAAHRQALQEAARHRAPLQWAGTQHALGMALTTLGVHELNTELLVEAATAFNEALKERTRECTPLDWATSSGNQGIAALYLASIHPIPALVDAAAKQLTRALEFMRTTDHPSTATYEEALAQALALRQRLTT